MKKICLLLILALVLSACQSVHEEMTVLDNISGISISKSGGYGAINDDFFMSISEEKVINDFEEVLKRATGQKHDIIVSDEKPYYDLLVSYEDGSTHLLHLILGSEGQESIFMYVGHEKNGFYVSTEDTKILRDILKLQ
ncbi:hypothetical protein [Halalkalibacter alkaliphilus]|uniref:YhfM-like domain-containing protein n=1 Tax=Halalkalibacter alkaliphilus TaxID=2917993 RepID=A0A9X2CWF1_9BACI|nr:hypothetical protein [Halalkalibacter alkaliphilus]MCL7749577.1 hypothetical protein [Halalkalibacter alkaliphilus]